MILNHARLPVPTRPREVYFSSGEAVGLDEGWQEEVTRAGALRQAQCERQRLRCACTSTGSVRTVLVSLRRAQCERFQQSLCACTATGSVRTVSATLRMHCDGLSANGSVLRSRAQCERHQLRALRRAQCERCSVSLRLALRRAQCERFSRMHFDRLSANGNGVSAHALRWALCERFQSLCACTATGSVRTVSVPLRMHCDGLSANGFSCPAHALRRAQCERFNGVSARALRRALCERFQLPSACTATGSVRTVSATLRTVHCDCGGLSANGFSCPAHALRQAQCERLWVYPCFGISGMHIGRARLGTYGHGAASFMLRQAQQERGPERPRNMAR